MNVPSKKDYIISVRKDFSAELKRIVEEQSGQAVFHLNESGDVHKGVHNARRCLKITRSVWRLIRDDLGEPDFRRKNDFYRDAGRALSALRDLTAMLETIDALEKKNQIPKAKAFFQKFREAFQLQRSLFVKKQANERKTLQKIAKEIKTKKKQINKFQLSDQYIPNIATSLERTYRRGQNCYKANKKKLDPARMHEWRKRAKYLRYFFHMLRESRPELCQKLEKRLHLLTDHLGNFNNLTVLKNHLQNQKLDLLQEDLNQLLQIVEQNQQELYESALALGAKLYAEKPETMRKLTLALLKVYSS